MLWRKRVDWCTTYHNLYRRGEAFDLDQVWADRLFFQTYGYCWQFKGEKMELLKWR